MRTPFDKALAALVMAILSLLDIFFGWGGGIGENTVLAIVAIATPLVVYFVPNAKR